MKFVTQLLVYGVIVVLAGCATPETAGPANPYQGTYIGIETLKGGSTVPAGDYPLKITISASGRIRITDVDGITASGHLENNQFRVVRSSPRQIFDGKIIDKIISGVTTANIYTGDGTFYLTLQEN